MTTSGWANSLAGDGTSLETKGMASLRRDCGMFGSAFLTSLSDMTAPEREGREVRSADPKRSADDRKQSHETRHGTMEACELAWAVRAGQ
jgi:hypothetical protein